MNINSQITIDSTDLIYELTHQFTDDQLLQFIKDIDSKVGDKSFTKKLTSHFEQLTGDLDQLTKTFCHIDELMLGNGEQSSAQCWRLQQMFMDAIKILGGLQQPPDPTEQISEKIKQERKSQERKDRSILKFYRENIFKALGGKLKQ